MGVFIGLAALWIPGFFHAVWRASMAARAAGLGLKVTSKLGPRVQLNGQLQGQPVELLLIGGLRGERLRLKTGDIELEQAMPSDIGALLEHVLKERS